MNSRAPLGSRTSCGMHHPSPAVSALRNNPATMPYLGKNCYTLLKTNPHPGESLDSHRSEGWNHDLGPVEWESGTEALMDRAEFWVTFRDCLSKLPTRAADVFMLRKMEEMEAAQICQAFNISQNKLMGDAASCAHGAPGVFEEFIAPGNWHSSRDPDRYSDVAIIIAGKAQLKSILLRVI
jgi:hypothetical protein